MKKGIITGLAVILCAALFIAVVKTRSSVDRSEVIGLSPVFSHEDLIAAFADYYEPINVDIAPKVSPYPLPLDPQGVQNLPQVTSRFMINEAAREKLLANGIVSIRYGIWDDIVEAYNQIKQMEVPVFVTSDSVLHLYHIQFDETLREIEEKEFYPDILGFSRAFQKEMEKRYISSTGLTKEAYKKGLAFFSVGINLLDPESTIPRAVKGWVNEELEKIEEHKEFKENAILMYREDYSQYVPRGHYTRSEKLKRYFKAMMWYGRLTMLIKGHEDYGPAAHQPALISPQEAQIQTMLGSAIAGLLSELMIGDRNAAQVWERMYMVTAYYVGIADDLTPQDYRGALRAVFGDSFKPEDLANQDTFLRLKSEIARMSPPAIYSGTGESEVNLDIEEGHALSAEQLDRILGKTMGFRLMGQRYVPDSYILGQVVAPVIGNKQGPVSFTTVMIPDHGPIRGFPRGLDVMAVMGSDRAVEIIHALEDASYQNYDKRITRLREEFGTISTAGWNHNLYWSWLYALKGMIEPLRGNGWPTFMTTSAWLDKQINAALGSWSSLRHDTILYAKQSYTPTITRESAEPHREIVRPVVGYVEPIPEFYARLVALTRMTGKGLSHMKVLDETSLGRLRSLEQLLSRLQSISEKELANETLTEDDYAFIRNFGENLSAIVTGASAKAQKTTLVADVHTDQNTKQVLEEATGHLRILVVAYKLPQGHILLGAGPAFSYYEFKHPMSDRLTDEKWRDMLQSGTAPTLPEWTGSFADL